MLAGHAQTASGTFVFETKIVNLRPHPPDKSDSTIGVDIRGSSVALVLGAIAWCGLHLCVVLLRRLADGISFRNAMGTFRGM